MLKKLNINTIAPLIIILFCAFLWTQTNQIPAPRFEPLGAAFFPRLNLAVIVILSTILLASNFLPSKDTSAEKPSKPQNPLQGYMRMLILLALLIIYMALISLTDLPYLALTFAYLFIFSWFLANFKPKLILPLFVSSAIITGLIYGIFGLFLEVFFP